MAKCWAVGLDCGSDREAPAHVRKDVTPAVGEEPNEGVSGFPDLKRQYFTSWWGRGHGPDDSRARVAFDAIPQEWWRQIM